VVCRSTMPKRDLIRVARTPEGTVVVDPRGKVPGRGAYLCPRPECFESGRMRDAIRRSLDVTIADSDWAMLEDDVRRLATERSVTER